VRLGLVSCVVGLIAAGSLLLWWRNQQTRPFSASDIRQMAAAWQSDCYQAQTLARNPSRGLVVPAYRRVYFEQLSEKLASDLQEVEGHHTPPQLAGSRRELIQLGHQLASQLDVLAKAQRPSSGQEVCSGLAKLETRL